MTVVDGVTVESEVEALAAGVIVARGCSVAPASETLRAAIAAAIEEAKSIEDPVEVRGAVRDLLRHGKYKPTGRGKPASEYLLKAAREDRFPAINNLVDINNLVSLRSLLPISLVDLGRAEADAFVLRRGHAGESYVFNSAEQTIDLTDLLLVARKTDDRACANPVKDSMATKLVDETTDVLAVLYAPRDLEDRLKEATAVFCRHLEPIAKSVESATIRSQ